MIRPRNPNRGIIPASKIEAAYRAAFTIPSPGVLRRITLALFGIAISNPFWMADGYYEESNEDLIKQAIAENQADKAQYITEKKDCDNFAFALMGALRGVDDRTCAMPIFITWFRVKGDQDAHALLSYYSTATGKEGLPVMPMVKLIEPQNDRIYPIPSDSELILLCG